MFSQLHFNLNVILLQWKRSVSWSCHVFVQCSWILSPNMRWFPWRTYFTCPHNDIREVMIHKTSHTPSVLNSSLMETSVPYIRNQVKFGSRTSFLFFLIFHSIVSTSRLSIFYVTESKVNIWVLLTIIICFLSLVCSKNDVLWLVSVICV